MSSGSLSALARRHEGKLWAVGLLGAIFVVGVGLFVAPEVFWDKFLWEDIWGPTLADARHVDKLCWTDGAVTDARFARDPCPGGTLATSGYTITAEVTYGLVLAALLYGIYQHVLKRYAVDTGGRFIVALLPLIVLGPFARVMQDARVFNRADRTPGVFAPFFISPWIYFQIALYALLFLAIGIVVDRAASRLGRRGRLGVVAGVLAVETVVYAVAVELFSEEFSAVAPAWTFALAAVAAFLFFAWIDVRPGWRLHGTTFSLGLPLLTPTFVLVAQWLRGDRWVPCFDVDGCPLFPFASLAILLLAGGATFLTWWVARLLAISRPKLLAIASGTGTALVLGHTLDGFATWTAIHDPFGLGLPPFVEKHPVSQWFLDLWPAANGFLYPLVKIVLVIVVITVLAPEFSGDREDDRTLGGLVLMAVFVLGFAPGLRDVLLVLMNI